MFFVCQSKWDGFMFCIRFYNLSFLDLVLQIYCCLFLYLHGKDRTLFLNGWRKLECLIRHYSVEMSIF